VIYWLIRYENGGLGSATFGLTSSKSA